MILCVGEILVDMIGETNDNVFSYQRRAGGAPFNVSCAIAKFHGQSGFIGNVGEDIIGKYLCDYASTQGLKYLNISIDKKHNTTLAFVDIDETGERNFCFYRKNTADYHLKMLTNKEIKKASIIHVGSLMLSEDKGTAYIDKLIEKVKTNKKYLSFDINFRTDIFKDKEEALMRYKKILPKFDILKFSEDEVEIFTYEYIKSLANNTLICISLGSKGSRYIYKDLDNIVPSIKVQPIDTTGAGDAFFAGVLSQLDLLDKSSWDASVLNKAFEFGNIAGALNTLGKGAIDNLPTYEIITNYMEKKTW